MTFLKSAPHLVVGIDVAKETLAIFWSDKNTTKTIKNETRAIAQLVKSFPENTFVVCEPTGGYESLLIQSLVDAGVPCHRADTIKVKAFRRSYGRLAKTDAIDANLLAAYGEDRWQQLDLFQLPPKEYSELTALVARRQDLLGLRTAERNREQAPGPGSVKKSCRKLLKTLDQELASINQRIEDVIEQCSELCQKVAICKTLPGVGPKTAPALMAIMPELGTLSRKQAASLAGLAPHPNESGNKKGYRRMRGGRPQVRSILFLAAMSAVRSRGQLKVFYQRLIENGKKKIVAIAAVMRKIIVILNAKIRDDFKLQS